MKSPQGLQGNSSFLLVYILWEAHDSIYITFTKGLCFLGLKNCTGVCSAFQLCRTLSPTAAIVEDFGDTLSRTFLRVSWKQKRMVQSTQHKKLCKRKSKCNKKSSNTHSQTILFLFTPFSKQVTARHCGRRQSAATFPYHAATAHLGVNQKISVFFAGFLWSIPSALGRERGLLSWGIYKILNQKRKRFNLELPARFLNTSLSLVFFEAKGLKLHILVWFFCSLGLVCFFVRFTGWFLLNCILDLRIWILKEVTAWNRGWLACFHWRTPPHPR